MIVGLNAPPTKPGRQYEIVLDRGRMLSSRPLLDAILHDRGGVQDPVRALAGALEESHIRGLATRTSIQYAQGARRAVVWDEGESGKTYEIPIPEKSCWCIPTDGGWGTLPGIVYDHTTVGAVHISLGDLGYTGPITHGKDPHTGWRGIYLTRRQPTCIFGVARVEPEDVKALRELAEHLKATVEELRLHSSTGLGLEKDERLIRFFIERAAHLEWLATKAEETASAGSPK